MVQEFIQLGECWMPSYVNFAAAEQGYRSKRLGGSVKRGGVGSCFRICEQPWSLLKDDVEADRRLFPSWQISQVAELGAFLDAGVDVIKIQGPQPSGGDGGCYHRDVPCGCGCLEMRSEERSEEQRKPGCTAGNVDCARTLNGPLRT